MTAVVLGWRLLSALSLVIFWGSLVGIAVLYGTNDSSFLLPAAGLALVGAGCGALVLGWLIQRGPRVAGSWTRVIRKVPGVDRIWGWVRSLVRGSQAVLSPRGAVLPAVALCTVWMADIGVAALFILDIVSGISVFVAVLAPVLANLSKVLRLTPGGIGIYEGVLSGLLVAAGGDLAPAVAAAALGHGFVNLVVLVVGAVPAYAIGHHTTLSLLGGLDRLRLSQAGAQGPPENSE